MKSMTFSASDRGVFCNRTLNLRSIGAIGYDMDYTLIHYHEKEWELTAYNHLKQELVKQGWPVEDLKFDPEMVCRGLIIDTEQGNLIKANRFGFIKRAMHGTRTMALDEQRNTYARTIVDLNERRWSFLNTLFSLSEGCMYAQLVDLLDQRKIPEVLGYADLYTRVKDVLDATHMEGKLKAEIIANPNRFVVSDPEIPLALLDQKFAGKKLMLITNSEWSYTLPMMSYAFDKFLPNSMTWRDLFDVVIVGARKPNFFTTTSPMFEVTNDEGLLKPLTGGQLKSGVAYLGGSAHLVERYLKLSGDEILYVGDHMFGDVHVTKNVLRWRTALIIRELELEVQSNESFRAVEQNLSALMHVKEELEAQICKARVELQRLKFGYTTSKEQSGDKEASLHHALAQMRTDLEELDHKIAPLAKKGTELNNPHWGLLMRSGNDKSYLAFQMERYADIYTSRVSNFLSITPFAYLRSPRGTLPHDQSNSMSLANPGTLEQ